MTSEAAPQTPEREECGERGERGGSVCALVAVKTRAQCKSRLQGALTSTARLALVRSMLSTVLQAASAARSVARVVLISPERDGVPMHIALLTDDGESLNAALAQAYALLPRLGCTAALILPADLPHVSAADLDTLVGAGRECGFALATDEAQRGTNALYLPAGAPFHFRFGPDSLRLHLQEAARLGWPARVVPLPGLSFDVDLPADLARLEGRARQVLAEAMQPDAEQVEPWPTRLQA